MEKTLHQQKTAILERLIKNYQLSMDEALILLKPDDIECSTGNTPPVIINTPLHETTQPFWPIHNLQPYYLYDWTTTSYINKQDGSMSTINTLN